MPEDQDPAKRIGGTLIGSPDDTGPPQNIHPLTTLTPGQLAALRANIKTERARLRSKREVPFFTKAVLWAYKIYGYDVHLESDFVPQPSFGSSFEAFVDFVYAKERDAEAEELVEEEEDER